MQREVKKERTGWRDEGISRRHREWGLDCPAVDIDFLLIEYNYGIAKGLVEYKHERAEEQHSTNSSHKALMNLGDRAGVPVFAVRYANDYSWWKVTALNKYAKKYIPTCETMTEEGYVDLLRLLRTC